MIDFSFIQKPSAKIFLGLFLFWIAAEWIILVVENRRIRVLGGRAPRLKTVLPFDIDMVIRSVRATTNHSNLEFWQSIVRGAPYDNFTTEVRPFAERVIFTCDPENIKAVLATQFQEYGKGKPFHHSWKAFLGDSIFTLDGEDWHIRRQMVRTQFIKDRVSDLNIFEKHVQVLMSVIGNGGIRGLPGVLSESGGIGGPVDVCDLFFRLTLDSATDYLFGGCVDSLEIKDQPFADAFTEVQRVQSLTVRAGPFAVFVPRKSFQEGIVAINEFVNPYIERALRLSSEELTSMTKADSGYTFLHALANFTRDKDMLRDQLIAILLGGRDTTACTLSWTFYELARHPEVVQKLRQEILATVGTNRQPTYNDLKGMKYLQNVMNETLRIYPVIPFNVRLALKDTTLPHGSGPDGLSPLGVLKNTAIAYSPLLMQRRPDIYPTEWSRPSPSGKPSLLHPLTFNPERWYDWQPKPWTFIPFNGGPRICVGQQFALTEMGYTIVRLLQRFGRIESRMTGRMTEGRPVMRAEVVLQSDEPVMLQFFDAER